MVERKFNSIKVATKLSEKTFGVIGWKNWGEVKGFLIPSCNSIHTFFVRFPIDVVFLDKDNKIVGLKENLRPFSFSPIFWRAKAVLELPENSIKKHSLELGNKLILN